MNKFHINFSEQLSQYFKYILLVNLLFIVSITSAMTNPVAAQTLTPTVTNISAHENSKNTPTLSLQGPKKNIFQGQASQWLLITPLNSAEHSSAEIILPKSADWLFSLGTPTSIERNAQHHLAYPLQLTAVSSGTVNLPTIKLKLAEQNLMTEPLNISVKPVLRSENMSLEVSSSTSEIYLGQSVRIDVLWRFDYPIEAIRALDFDIAALRHQQIKVFPPWNKVDSAAKTSISVPVSGRRQIARWQHNDIDGIEVAFTAIIKPTEAGIYQFPAATIRASIDQAITVTKNNRFKGTQYLAYFNNKFFDDDSEQKNTARVFSTSKPLTLKVKALPTPVPSNFSGIINRPMISASAAPLTVKQGEPIQYSLTIKHPDLEVINLPKLQQEPAFSRKFAIPAEASPALYKQNEFKQGEKLIHQTLFPKQANIAAIPPLTVNYFDTTSGRYRDYQVPMLVIEVNENDQFNFSEAESSDQLVIENNIEKDPEGIWAHHWDDALTNSSSVQQAKVISAKFGHNLLVILFFLVPSLVFALFLFKPMQLKWQKKRQQQPFYYFKDKLMATDAEPLQILGQYCFHRLALAPSLLSGKRVEAAIFKHLTVESKRAETVKLAKTLKHWIDEYQANYAQQGRKLTHHEKLHLLNLINALEQLLVKKTQLNFSSKHFTTSWLTLACTLLLSVAMFVSVLDLSPQRKQIIQPLHSQNIQHQQVPINNASMALFDTDVTITSLRQQHHQALQLSIDSPHKGHLAHGAIAQKFVSLFNDKNINTAALSYNIASSWFHAKNYGESIAWYRRAENMQPQDTLIQHNLSQARQQRIDNLPNYFAPNWLSHIYQYADHWLTLSFISITYALFWFMLWRAVISAGPKRKAANKALVLSTLLLNFLFISQLYIRANPLTKSDGVITSHEVVSRKGPGLIFSPAFTTPLHQGTEFLLLAKENNWRKIQLSNGLIGWLPARAITMIEE